MTTTVIKTSYRKTLDNRTTKTVNDFEKS